MASQSSNSSVLAWPLPLGALWLLFPVCGLLLRVALEPVAPHDYWWHLAMGRMVAETGTIPSHNLFVHTLPADLAFHDQPWLAQWAMYVGWSTGHHAGLVVGRNLIAAATWAGLMWAGMQRCEDPRFVGGVALVVAALTGAIFGVRTQMFAFLPYVGLLAVVLGVADGRLDRRWLFALAPLTALWANLHGTFVLAPLLVGLVGAATALEAWWGGRAVDRRRLAVWMGAAGLCAVAALLNPWGPRVYWYVIHLSFVSDIGATVTEWQPPDPSGVFGILAIVGVLASLAVAWKRRASLRWHEAVLLGAGAYLGLSAVRSLFWWGAIAVLVVPRHLHDWVQPPAWNADTPSPWQGAAHAAAALVLVGGVVLSQPGLPVFEAGQAAIGAQARRGGEGAGVLSARNATSLVNRLKDDGWTGRIFHDQSIGGLLDFKLGARDPARPRAVAFLDQRMEMIPERVWRDYFQISAAAPGWRELLREYDVGTLILAPEEQGLLIQEVQASPAWAWRGIDERHLLFERVGAR